jgi:large repetitive protein
VDTEGSETLRITVAGVPTGATLSHGVNNGNGSWTLTPAQLAGLTITPPSNYSGSFNLTVTATSAENGTTATTQATLGVSVAGVADAPSLSVQAATGNEDTAIALNIASALVDTDGSEALGNITIAGVPTGATLNHGVNNGNGTWTLTPAQLSGLMITPPSNYSGSFNLTVTATSSENGTTATTQATLGVSVAGVADAPSLSLQAATGNEDTAIALNIASALVDTDGSETLSITIAGMPAGATLNKGTNNGNGSWTLTPAQLAGLTITPASNYSGSFNLTVTATSSENGTTANTQATLGVKVTGVADVPTLTVQAASGNEDTAIPLTITSALTDTDGSETLSVVISGVPAGALLSAGTYAGGGQWTLSAAQLAGLTITPPANYSGAMALTVTAVSTENSGSMTTKSAALNVTVAPVADQPTLSVSAARGNEDTAISLSISSALVDTDGSESLSIRISGVPTGATLNQGTNLGGGIWSLTPAQLSGLKITPPANSDADFTLTVTATSTEAVGGGTASRNTTLAVTVDGVADAPAATASNVTAALGATINLSLGGALVDADGSESALTYIVHGMPDGFALNKGINNGDNTWTLTQAQLTGLQLVPPPKFQGQLNLNVSAVAHENDGAVAMGTPTPFYVRIGTYASGPQVSIPVGAHTGGVGEGVVVSGSEVDQFQPSGGLFTPGGMYVKEDTQFVISDAAAIANAPALALVLGLLSNFTITGYPAGTTFNRGTNLGNGTWAVGLADLTDLRMTPASNSDANFTMTIQANLIGLLPIGVASTVVNVMGQADLPTLTASAGTAAEDNAVPIAIVGSLVDTDGSESSSYLVSGMPAGSMLNHGINNGNGTWSLTTADLSGLTMTPPANWSGSGTITVSHVSTEREGDQAVRQTTANFSVTPVADAPTVRPPSHSGTEDTPLSLNFGVALTDTDGSESISSVTVSGLPTGASLTNATNNGDGTWNVSAAQINNVKFVPAMNWSGDVSLTITATSRESANGVTSSTNSTLAVHISPVADTPTVFASNVTDQPNTSGIGLSISAGLTDTDGSERLSVVVSGMPQGTMLSAGLHNPDGSWTLTPAQLSALSITPPSGFTGDMTLTATAYSIETDGSSASSHQNFVVHVDYEHSFHS